MLRTPNNLGDDMAFELIERTEEHANQRGYFVPLYLVKPNRRHEAGIMYTLTCPAMLTLKIDRGDEVLGTGAVFVSFLNGKRFVTCQPNFWANPIPGQVGVDPQYPNEERMLRYKSHAGRSASLGEDGLEDAYGHGAEHLLQLVAELLIDNAHWNYSPADFDVVDASLSDIQLPQNSTRLVAQEK